MRSYEIMIFGKSLEFRKQGSRTWTDRSGHMAMHKHMFIRINPQMRMRIRSRVIDLCIERERERSRSGASSKLRSA
jgi:hypothetical protein